MLVKILGAVFLVVLLGKLFFRPQLAVLGKFVDRLVNATLFAIVIVWGIQLWLLLAQ